MQASKWNVHFGSHIDHCIINRFLWGGCKVGRKLLFQKTLDKAGENRHGAIIVTFFLNICRILANLSFSGNIPVHSDWFTRSDRGVERTSFNRLISLFDRPSCSELVFGINFSMIFVTFSGCVWLKHYSDDIMGAIESQITSLAIVFSTVYLDTDQRKHQSFASLVFVWGIHQ